MVAEYDVFITTDLTEELYLLQYPNRAREEPYNAASHNAPMNIRMKPKAGFIEVEVPLNVKNHFDKYKGIKFGEALRKAKEDGQSSFGVAAGFDKMPAPPRVAGGTAQIDDFSDHAFDHLLQKFEDANDKGHVMNKQTLGGQVSKREPGDPMYMLGAFRGKELHLTKLSGVFQMRPQFHHLDAITHLEQSNRRREAAEGAKPPEARAVHVTVKAADQHDSEAASTKKFLQVAKEDAWVDLRYHDEDAPEAYAAYHNKLFVDESSVAPKLQSTLNNEQYLEAISAPRQDPSGQTKKKPLTKKQIRAIDETDESEQEG